MGDFRIIINAVGNHGHDRENKTGKDINFGEGTPEALAKKFVEELQASGATIESAYVEHWPIDNYGGQLKNGRSQQIVDDLINNTRTDSF